MPGACLSSQPAPSAATATQPVHKAPAPAPVPIAVLASAVPATPSHKMVKIAIIYYSMYGHVLKLAEAIKAGAESVPGVQVTILQVPETLPAEVLTKMHAPPKAAYPTVSAADLPQYDGFVFGFPTRFGMMSAQFKAFFDTTGQLWQAQTLAGKPAGLFTSTASQGGGQETTLLTAISQLVHHGMPFIPLGYAAPNGSQFTLDEVKGGSPYGAGTYAGPTGARQPSALELSEATHQGTVIAKATVKLAAP